MTWQFLTSTNNMVQQKGISEVFRDAQVKYGLYFRFLLFLQQVLTSFVRTYDSFCRLSIKLRSHNFQNIHCCVCCFEVSTLLNEWFAPVGYTLPYQRQSENWVHSPILYTKLQTDLPNTLDCSVIPENKNSHEVRHLLHGICFVRDIFHVAVFI